MSVGKGGGSKQIMTCQICSRVGHTAATCIRAGNPPSQGQVNKGNEGWGQSGWGGRKPGQLNFGQQGGRGPKCFKCNKFGHISGQCPDRSPSLPPALPSLPPAPHNQPHAPGPPQPANLSPGDLKAICDSITPPFGRE